MVFTTRHLSFQHLRKEKFLENAQRMTQRLGQSRLTEVDPDYSNLDTHWQGAGALDMDGLGGLHMGCSSSSSSSSSSTSTSSCSSRRRRSGNSSRLNWLSRQLAVQHSIADCSTGRAFEAYAKKTTVNDCILGWWAHC